MKLDPKMREALREFINAALTEALDGVEAQVKPGTPRIAFDFRAENALVKVRVDIDTPLFWGNSDGS